MPPGLTLNPSGVISGTPTQAGTYTVAVTVTDQAGAIAQGNLTMNIGVPLSITTIGITGTTGVPFSYALQAVGGVSPYTWVRLDTGATLANGVLTGAYAAAGSYTVPIRLTDSVGHSVTGNLVVTVSGPT
jgi:hypothetical protein